MRILFKDFFTISYIDVVRQRLVEAIAAEVVRQSTESLYLFFVGVRDVCCIPLVRLDGESIFAYVFRNIVRADVCAERFGVCIVCMINEGIVL